MVTTSQIDEARIFSRYVVGRRSCSPSPSLIRDLWVLFITERLAMRDSPGYGMSELIPAC